MTDNEGCGEGVVWEVSAELLHRVCTCEGCGEHVMPALMIQQPCPTGDCVQTVCPHCRHEWSSWGPVLCKSCGDLNWYWRQWHRIDMWFFDKVTLPLRSMVRKWRRR